jgi:hypothetical protein
MPSHRVTARRLLRRSTRTWEPPPITSHTKTSGPPLGLSRGMPPYPQLPPRTLADFANHWARSPDAFGLHTSLPLTIRCTSAVLVILNIGCSSMRPVVRMPIRGIVDRWHLPGLKSVSTLMTHTCLNTRSKGWRRDKKLGLISGRGDDLARLARAGSDKPT